MVRLSGVLIEFRQKENDDCLHSFSSACTRSVDASLPTLAQNNNEIIDTCEDEQWTKCNESYRKCQMKVNAAPCPCFRTLLDCGDVTGCLV
jgi:hypothetical protein